MKKIIRTILRDPMLGITGREPIEYRLYDTETAVAIGSFEEKTPANYIFKRTLYITPNNNYFLTVETLQCPKTTISDCEIMEMSKDQAFSWAEKHMSVEKIIPYLPLKRM